MTAAIQAQIAAAKAQKPPSLGPAALPQGKTPPTKREPATAPQNEPTSSHVQLPPPPPDQGPWTAADWTIRRSVAYEPAARVMLVGPSDQFERMLAHIQAFKP